MPITRQTSQRNPASSYGLLVLAVVMLSLAGNIGYELYPRFDLPAASGVGLLLPAAAAGIASFFSPCSFPLLVTLLSQQGESHHPDHWRVLRHASALALGAVIFLALVGMSISLGGDALFGGITFTSTAGRLIRTMAGALLLLLGLVQLGYIQWSFYRVADLTTPLMRRQANLRRQKPALGFGLYGFTYLLTGFG